MPNSLSVRPLVLLTLISLAWGQPVNSSHGLAPVGRSQLCITKGKIEIASGKHLEVTVPEMRAVLGELTPQHVEAHFTYLGPSADEKRLGSGELRRQLGLKLRAANGCNLVYAMWRIEPKSELVISVKSNPGMSTHAECGTHGYTNITAERSLPVPQLQKGSSHTMRAKMHESKLQVWVDQKLAWEGDVGQAAMAFDGPVGIRTDNGRFKFELFTDPPVKSSAPIPCHASNEDE
jgi:hypothetical protein